jgi:hypothetical protein
MNDRGSALEKVLELNEAGASDNEVVERDVLPGHPFAQGQHPGPAVAIAGREGVAHEGDPKSAARRLRVVLVVEQVEVVRVEEDAELDAVAVHLRVPDLPIGGPGEDAVGIRLVEIREKRPVRRRSDEFGGDAASPQLAAAESKAHGGAREK